MYYNTHLRSREWSSSRVPTGRARRRRGLNPQPSERDSINTLTARTALPPSLQLPSQSRAGLEIKTRHTRTHTHTHTHTQHTHNTQHTHTKPHVQHTFTPAAVKPPCTTPPPVIALTPSAGGASTRPHTVKTPGLWTREVGGFPVDSVASESPRSRRSRSTKNQAY